MSQIKKYPYLTPVPTNILFGEWQLAANGVSEPLGKILANWDPAIILEASINVKLSYAAILKDCGFSNDVRLRILPMWKSEGTFLKGHGEFVDLYSLGSQDEQSLDLHINVSGIDVSESIDLWVQLILLESRVKKSNPFSAQLPGSILAQSVPHRVIVEGEGPRFPIEIIDFSNTYYPSNAGWYFHWDSGDLFQSVLGGVRLYINAKHERVVKAVTAEHAEDFDIREAIRYDIARLLINGALSNDEFIMNADVFPSGSVGAAVRSMLGVYFPEIDFVQLQSKIARPELFEADLQERLQIFQQRI